MADCDRPIMPLLGEKLPEFEAITTNGPIKLPGDFQGSWFVLFSHPADFTPVCTTEFVAFQKLMGEFDALGCKLVGLSIDQVFAHIKWMEWIQEKLGVNITFPVIAANDSLAIKLGMLHPGKGTNTVRVVFIVDPKGTLRLMIYYPQEVGRNMKEIVRAVKALQTADTQGPTPADWPNSDLIGDRIIMPPARTREDARKRLSEQPDCYDWWFCHKEYKK